MNTNTNNEPIDPNEFISLARAAKLTGYHPDYLGQLARSGKLDSKKIGRNWVTTKLSIDRFLGRIQEEEQVAAVAQEVMQPVVAEPVIAEPQKVFAETVVQETKIEIQEPISTSVVEVTTPQPEPVVAQPIVQETFERIERVEQISEPVRASQNFPSKQKTKSYTRQHTDLQALVIGAISEQTPDHSTKKYLVMNFYRICEFRKERLEKNTWRFADYEQAAAKSKPMVRKTNFETRRKNFAPAPVVRVAKKKTERIFEEEIPAPVFARGFSYKLNVALFVLAMVSLAGFVGFNYLNHNNQETPQMLSEQTTNADQNETIESVGDDQEIAGISTSTIGQQTLPANKDEITVFNDSIGVESNVLVNFRDEYAGHYWIAQQSKGQFTLKVSERPEKDLPFEYAILGDN